MACLSIGTHRCCHKRNITIGANQIEIVESTQGKYFSTSGLPITTGEARIDFIAGNRHLVALFKDEITIVDAGVESRPVKHIDTGLQDSGLEIHDVGVGNAVQREIVRTEFSPKEDSFRLSASSQLLVRTGAHILQVTFLLPEVLFRQLVCRKNRQEILARRQTARSQKHASNKKKFCI